MAQIEWNIAMNGLRGKAGHAVFAKGPTGAYVRSFSAPEDPRTPAQAAVRDRFSRAAKTFKSLSAEQYEEWAEYAQTVRRYNKRTDVAYTPSAIAEFIALATKYLQVNPLSAIPLAPPSGEFLGDTIGVAFVAGPASGEVTVTASGANAAGVVTELLLQRITGPGRKPRQDGYRPQAFNQFLAGSGLTVNLVDLKPGYYTAAYRFVQTATGRESPLQTLEVAGAVGAAVAAAPLRKAA